jgi:hypothetical protein
MAVALLITGALFPAGVNRFPSGQSFPHFLLTAPFSCTPHQARAQSTDQSVCSRLPVHQEMDSSQPWNYRYYNRRTHDRYGKDGNLPVGISPGCPVIAHVISNKKPMIQKNSFSCDNPALRRAFLAQKEGISRRGSGYFKKSDDPFFFLLIG